MPHQIERLTVHAFRQLKALELEKLGRINLFVGVNNSGKTSVLEAISTHCNPLNPLEWINTARRRYVKSSREPELDAVRWLFPQHHADHEDAYYKGEVRVEGDGRYANLESWAYYNGIMGAPDEAEIGSYNGDNEDEFDDEFEETSESYTTTGPDRGAEIRLTARVPSSRWLEFDADGNGFCQEQFRLWEDERFVSRAAPSELCLPVATVSPFAHRVRQLQLSQATDATLKGTKFSVIDLVKLLDSDVEDLEILSRSGIRPTLYIRHKHTGFTPLSALGDGVRRVLTIALNLTSVQHGALLIDEIETAIHKDALGRVFSWLVKACLHYDVQMFATTHSLEAVDAVLGAKDIDLEEVNGYRLETKKGRTSARRYSGDLLHRLRHERALDVR